MDKTNIRIWRANGKGEEYTLLKGRDANMYCVKALRAGRRKYSEILSDKHTIRREFFLLRFILRICY